jgi:hypothetical protein
MAEELTNSSSETRKGGKRTKNAPPLTLQDEFAILESQASDVAKAGGRVQWAVLYPGGELAMVFPDGSLCDKCNRPYIGSVCWNCGAERE